MDSKKPPITHDAQDLQEPRELRAPRGLPGAKKTPEAPDAQAAQQADAAATSGLTKLGQRAAFRFERPEASILEAFANPFPDRDYVVTFEHPEFTSLCPMTGQPDFGLIRLRYAPGERCVESKSFKLYLGAFRNHGAFMETLTNSIADDLSSFLKPRRLTVEGLFNPRGGTAISVRVEYMDRSLPEERRAALAGLW